MYQILDNINDPSDIRGLDIKQLETLCSEIRDYIIKCCATNPGHLGSSLGAVELIVGLHYVYNTPEDKLVFDVGHQAYAHKILTGRREAFRQNRTKDGISGFPKMSESPFDAFGTGHSSTSISAALGLSEAIKMKGGKEKVAALIGDGALTGGLALEGLNNAGGDKSDLLVILNDNDQSISKNIGGLNDYLLRLTTGSTYNRVKRGIWNRLGDNRFRRWLQKITVDAKSNLVRGSGGALFEALGFRYFGPIDGNDISQVVNTLRRLKDIGGPRLLHVHTIKGKGYAAAEADPSIWHAPGRFDPETGKRLPSNYKAARYQDVFGEVLLDLARKDDRIVGITPAMSLGCGMDKFAEAMPGRFYDVGIEEEHAVTFSAGLAAGGMRPFCNIYSSFIQRAYDQVIHDCALQGLPVVLCLDRSGVVGEDGPTHHGSFDISAFRPVPGVVIAAPRNEYELKCQMYTALHHEGGPYIIRYPRGCGEGVSWREEEYRLLPEGKAEKLRDGEGLAIIAAGPAAEAAAKAADLVRQKHGRGPVVFDARFIKPLDEEMLKEAAAIGNILTVEDGSLIGGLYGAVSEYMVSKAPGATVSGSGIPDMFIGSDKQSSQHSDLGIDVQGLALKIENLLKFPQKVLENKI